MWEEEFGPWGAWGKNSTPCVEGLPEALEIGSVRTRRLLCALALRAQRRPERSRSELFCYFAGFLGLVFTRGHQEC